MSANIESIRSLWVPLRGLNLLLPNVAVAEVIGTRPLEELDGGPSWLLGSLTWRGQQVPVISYEMFCNHSEEPGHGVARIAVMNTTRKNTRLPFFAVLCSGIPRLFQADSQALEDVVAPAEAGDPEALGAVRMGSEMAVIPDLERVHGELESVWPETAPA